MTAGKEDAMLLNVAPGDADVVLEEESKGVHIYRMKRRDASSFFGRMWRRGRAANFLLRLRKGIVSIGPA